MGNVGVAQLALEGGVNPNQLDEVRINVCSMCSPPLQALLFCYRVR